MHINDLHCDLLCYLASDPTRTAHDVAVRCAIPQLRQGNVKFQTLAVFTETSEEAPHFGEKQVEIFKALPQLYPSDFAIVRSVEDLDSGSKIGVMLAFENASSFCGEDELIESGFGRLDATENGGVKVVYISMTWNGENRFGGGASTSIGLKSDGKRLLDYIDKKRIAIDFSHASDRLAYDILDYIDAKGLDVPVLASHSNFRAVANMPRNLPDDLAKEIAHRGGVIGLNFVRYFVGNDDPKYFVEQVSHACALGVRDHLCFGADFFYGNDVPPLFRKAPEEYFFPSFDNAGCYPQVIEMWRQNGLLTANEIAQISHITLQQFLRNKIFRNP